MTLIGVDNKITTAKETARATVTVGNTKMRRLANAGDTARNADDIIQFFSDDYSLLQSAAFENLRVKLLSGPDYTFVSGMLTMTRGSRTETRTRT